MSARNISHWVSHTSPWVARKASAARLRAASQSAAEAARLEANKQVLMKFFALGGDSLHATQILSRVRETFGREVTLRAFFEAASVAGDVGSDAW